MQFHDPEGVAAQIAPDAAGRKVLLLSSEFLIIELHDEIAMLAVRSETKGKLLPFLGFLSRAR